MATELTIGKLADAAGVNVETIRYYQRRGLLDEPAKPLGGHRRYPVDMVKRLRFIVRLCRNASTGCTQARVDRAEDGRLGRHAATVRRTGAAM